MKFHAGPNTMPPQKLLRGLKPRKTSIARVYGQALILLLPLVTISVIVSNADIEFRNWFNLWAPLYLMFATSLAAFWIIRTSSYALWSPAFWLLIASAIYFGLGPLVEIFGNSATKVVLNTGTIVINELELFNSNRLSIISVYLMMFGFWLHAQLARGVWARALTGSRKIGKNLFRPSTIAVSFVIIGMIFVHAILRPSNWGMIDFTVPGALTSIHAIVDVGFGLVVFLAMRGSKNLWLIFVLLWPIHVFLTLMSFSKSAVLIALIMPALGAYMSHGRMVRLLISASLIFAVYYSSQDFVSHGRSVIFNETGTIYEAGYSDRIKITSQYVASLSEDVPSTPAAANLEDDQDWWLRLNYSGVQAIGMRYRERGIFIDTTSDIWTFFIPRVLWPGKPIYEPPGAAFYTLMTGRTGTFVGNSVIGDVYWQFGWAGTIVIMPLLGCLFAMLSWRSIEIMRRSDFVRMPLVLISILLVATGLTKWLSNGIIAAIPIYLAYAFLIYIAEQFLRPERSYSNSTRSAPRFHQVDR